MKTLRIVVLLCFVNAQGMGQNLFHIGDKIKEVKYSLTTWAMSQGKLQEEKIRFEEDLIGMNCLSHYSADRLEQYYFGEDSICNHLRCEARQQSAFQELREMEDWVIKNGKRNADKGYVMGNYIFYFFSPGGRRTEIMLIRTAGQ